MGILPVFFCTFYFPENVICINNCTVLSDRKSFEWTRHNPLVSPIFWKIGHSQFLASHSKILSSPDRWTDRNLGLRFYQKWCSQKMWELVRQTVCGKWRWNSPFIMKICWLSSLKIAKSSSPYAWGTGQEVVVGQIRPSLREKFWGWCGTCCW